MTALSAAGPADENYSILDPVHSQTHLNLELYFTKRCLISKIFDKNFPHRLGCQEGPFISPDKTLLINDTCQGFRRLWYFNQIHTWKQISPLLKNTQFYLKIKQHQLNEGWQFVLVELDNWFKLWSLEFSVTLETFWLWNITQLYLAGKVQEKVTTAISIILMEIRPTPDPYKGVSMYHFPLQNKTYLIEMKEGCSRKLGCVRCPHCMSLPALMWSLSFDEDPRPHPGGSFLTVPLSSCIFFQCLTFTMILWQLVTVFDCFLYILYSVTSADRINKIFPKH